MKAFQEIVTGIGLSPTTTVVRAGPADSIVYEAVLDTGKTKVTGISIDVEHKLKGYLDSTTWDPPSGNGAGQQVAVVSPSSSDGAQHSSSSTVLSDSPPEAAAGVDAGVERDKNSGGEQPSGTQAGHTIQLSAVQAVMNVGECRFSVACRWNLMVESCGSEGMDLVFANDSDQVTTWVAKMAYLMMNDIQDYLL